MFAATLKVALGQRDYLKVFGGDYPTPDGSAIRDYIHVMDLAEGHAFALKKLLHSPDLGCRAVNLGTGKGTSVLEMVKTFEEVNGVKVPFKIVDRRLGDSISVYAATDLAEEELGWKAKFNVEDMCRDQWRWAHNNPKGFEENGDTPVAKRHATEKPL